MKNPFLRISIFAAVFTFGLVQCKKDLETPSSGSSTLVISPDTLIMYEFDTTKSFSVSSRNGENIDYEITAYPNWLKLEKTAGKISGNIDRVGVKPIVTGLSAGVYKGDIEIISNIGGKGKVKVFFSLSSKPIMEVSPLSKSINATTKRDSILIRNAGRGVLYWELISSPAWLQVANDYGVLEDHESSYVSFNLNRSGLNPGTYTDSLIFKESYGNTTKSIGVTIDVQTISELSILPENVEFSATSSQSKVKIVNTGNDASPVNWTLSGLPSYIIAVQNSGTLAKGDSIDILLNLDRSSFATSGVINGTFSINYGGTSISGTTTVYHLKQEKHALNKDVTDAEFSRSINKIVYVSASDLTLNVFDPLTLSNSSVSLTYIPTCVSVSADNSLAAVGHDGKVTVVNLNNMTVEKTMSASCEALDIVIGNNNYVYVFPKTDQWETVRCLNIVTGVETQSTGSSIYAGTKARMHPSGKYIYGGDNGLSPSDLEKYDIQNGTLKYLYDSPYHGDYPIGGDVWFSEDGNRIFSKWGIINITSEVKESDMLYDGKLVLTSGSYYGSFITSLHEDKEANRVFLFTSSGYNPNIQRDTVVRVYNSTAMYFEKNINLEPFLAPNGPSSSKMVSALGKFVFASSDGQKLYVITEAPMGYGIANRFAFQLISVN